MLFFICTISCLSAYLMLVCYGVTCEVILTLLTVVRLTFGEKGVDVYCWDQKGGHVEYAVYVTNYDNLCHYKSGVEFDVRPDHYHARCKHVSLC